MPDWQKLVSQRLTELTLDPEEKHEIFAELAGHLEEVYESLREEGLSEQQAIHRTLSQVKDWKNLRRKIHSARTQENTMTPRTARLWLPCFVTLTVSMLMLPVLERIGINPQFVFLRAHHESGQTYVFTVYTVWLALLPLVGALGAHLSKRAGGTQQAVITSATFPALTFGAVLMLVLPVMGLLEHGMEKSARPFFHAWTTEPIGVLGVVAGWVVMPGVSLLIGVLAYEAAAKWRLKSAT